jgi:prepilin-type N-terminal cleavage/methylation domain-containing protein
MRKIKQMGFTLVELAVVIVIIGVLAAFGVPRFRDAVEKSKAAESFNYLAAVRSAQERFAAQQGTYASLVSQLDIQMGTAGAENLKYFTADAKGILPNSADVVSGASSGAGDYENGWQLTLTRNQGSGGYGQYTVTFDQDGFMNDATSSTIVNVPAINPMGGTITSSAS